MELGKIRQTVRSRFGFAVAIAVISFIAIFSFGFMAFMAERDVMIKNTTIRGHSIAKMLSILNEDATVNRDPQLLERYTGEIGRERDIIFIEITQGNKLIAQYRDNKKTSERYVRSVSRPLVFHGESIGVIKVGFSIEQANDNMYEVKKITVIVGILALSFFISYFILLL
jgi:hypothetical protein